MTPAGLAALAVCVVVAVRIWITARTDKMLPEYPPRRYLDAGLALIAIASVIRAAGGWIDSVARHPGLSDLCWRIPVSAAGSCMILYLEAQRTRRTITVRRIVAVTWPTLVVIALISFLWSQSSFHDGNAADVLPAGVAAPWAERLYVVIFDVHLLTWTVPLAIRNWNLARSGYNSRRNATAREKSTAVGQLGMTIAAGSGSAAVAITITRALTVGIFGLGIEKQLHSIGTVLSYTAPVGAAIGIGFPAVANLVNSYRTLSLLRSLDAVLHSKDDAANNPEQSRPPLGIRLQPFTFAIEHYRARTADTLRSVAFTEQAALSIVTDDCPERAMGAALSDLEQWEPVTDQSTQHRTAYKLLPEVSTSPAALNQLIAIAAATSWPLRSTRRRGQDAGNL